MLKSLYNKSLLIALYCFLCNQNSYGQHHISKFEYRWAFAHPFSALKVKKHVAIAMLVYKDVKAQKLLDDLEYGGKLDAFRHTYTMAYLSLYVKPKKLKKLGEAHEKGNEAQFYKKKSEFGERPDSLASVMDLHNNSLGFEIGQNFNKSTKKELFSAVINAIKAGKAIYLKRNEANSYVTCNNEVLNMKFYIKAWYVPKCLIATNL